MPDHSAILVWFRRDLRLHDHAALYHALRTGPKVYCAFVFDTTILSSLPRQDKRVSFIWESCRQLDAELRQAGSQLLFLHGDPVREIPALARQLNVSHVMCNRDYEPDAIRRDEQVAHALQAAGVRFDSYKDQVIFEQDEVLTQSGTPYSVFTPYKNAWLKRLTPFFLQSYPCRPAPGQLAATGNYQQPSLTELGFEVIDLAAGHIFPGSQGAEKTWLDFTQRLPVYHQTRDFPAIKGPSYLSVHLRFGTISIRQLVAFAVQEGSAGAQTWLSELIWRDFYHQILWHFPHAATTAFKADYQSLVFPNNPHWLAAWKAGQTGYPIVDAAMRQLNQSGYMHNRLRMIAASFLVKDLLIDWRLGEAYFAEKLLDFDLAANNGGWQWSASTGCDAQPYFRIFNPISQSEKFDAAGKFIRRYVPELANLSDKAIHAPWQASPIELAAAGVTLGKDYPAPIVDHGVQRVQALDLFKAAKGG
ncbi:cryptochrome/photolyase family protein [Leeia oryzae]|uniref:cryptochrome/photolyase family protein n=1 Tax=Leeia oryzae TaxID=356662 RepID=UPI000382277B|nr:deoxyribodipyrimidine photo-lyase [Leeia oryzae]